MPVFIFCDICHRHHWSHYHQRVELLFAFDDPSQGDIDIMANTIDITESTPPVDTFYGSLGALTDANGQTVEDTVATATWSVVDDLVATVAPNPNSAIDAVFTITGNGTSEIDVSGTTASGASVTGTGTVTVSGFGTTVGPATTVEVVLSTTDPTAPITPPAA